MDELRVSLVSQRAENQFVVGAFNGSLIVLRVVVDARMGQQIALVVLVREVLRAVHVARLGAKVRIQREEYLLGDVHGVGSGHHIVNLHVVTFLTGNLTAGNLSICDGVEAVEEVHRRVTGSVALTCPDGVIQMFRQ